MLPRLLPILWLAVTMSCGEDSGPATLQLNRADSGRTIAVPVGEKLVLTLQTIGPGQFGVPEVSSPVLRLLSSGLSPLQNPGGPRQVFELRAESPGKADLRIPHTEMTAAFTLMVEVSSH
jgi:hypothetical protein